MTLSLNSFLPIYNWMKRSPIGISALPLTFEMFLQDLANLGLFCSLS